MRTVRITTQVNLRAGGVMSHIALPGVPLGEQKSFRTIEITGVPEDATDAQVIKAWGETTDISGGFSGGPFPSDSYAFADIGNGKIYRASALGQEVQ